MSNHINEAGQFQSDLHPDLPPDHITLDFDDHESQLALAVLAMSYQRTDPELSRDIVDRLDSLAPNRLRLRSVDLTMKLKVDDVEDG